MGYTTLTLGSLFDGSGGFPMAGLLCGITPVWASEIEPFPIRVTTKRLPFMKHYGDISQMDGGRIEPVDIITFGSPCTDMSIAGKRSGLDGRQSVLFYQAIRIIKEMRCATNGRYPRYIVWENVPGAFSSNKGADFKAVLEAVIGIVEPDAQVPMPEKNAWPYADLYMGDGWSVAYRTLDAQYWGVPQRRKRIFLVADFADGSSGQILFESEGLSRYSAESFRAWQRTARTATPCSGAAGGICLNDQGGSCIDLSHEVTGTLRAENHGHPPCVLDAAPAVSSNYGMGGNNQPLVVKDEKTPKTLKIRSGCEGGGKGALVQDDKSATLSCGNDQTVFVPKAYGICSKASNAMLSDNPHSGIYEAETSRTLDANGGNPGCNQGGIAVVESYAIQGSMIGREDKNGPQGDGVNEDVAFMLNTVDRHAVYAMTTGYFTQVEEDTSPTLTARDFKDPTTINCGYTVRRLTPIECARLQGFPDWWCADLGTPEPTMDDIRCWYGIFETHRRITGAASKPKSLKQIAKWLKAPYTDAAEYKMWGNGVALPCVFFVLAGIVWANKNEGAV